MTEAEIRMQLEFDGEYPPDDCIRELAEADACQIDEICGQPYLAISTEGLVILKRYSAVSEVANELFHHFSVR